MAGLALTYAVLAKIMLAFFSSNGVVSIIWPSSGLAVAALLIGGKKDWPGIFIGALAGNLMGGSPAEVSIFIALGNTLEALTCVWLLISGKCFNSALNRMQDYVWLIGAAAISVCISALIGVITLWLVGILTTPQAIAVNLLHWWQGDVLGIVLVTPLLLIWRRLPHNWFSRERAIEAVFCFGLAFLLGQSIFLGWFHDSFTHVIKDKWMFIFVIWSALRFGRHGVLLIITMTAIQMFFGAIHGAGIFSTELAQANLIYLWLSTLLMALLGMALALSITERNLIADSLRSSEERLKIAADSGQIGIWEYNIQTRELIWDDKMFALYGARREDFSGVCEAWSTRLHPEDRVATEAALRDAIAGIKEYNPEFRVIGPNGEIHYIKAHGHVVRDQAGKPVRMIGTNWDNHSNAHTQKQLELTLAAINRSRSAFLWLNSEGKVTDINDYVCQNLGYSREELIGQYVWFFDMDFPAEAWPKHWAENKNKGIRTFESHHRRKDGTFFPVEITTNFITIDGEEYSFSFTHDITERKRAEQRIVRLTCLYKALSEVNQAIVRMEQQTELFPLVCRCAVNFGGMKLAWVGQLDKESGNILPVASHGDMTGYLDSIPVSSHVDVPEGCGVTGTAMRENRSIIVNDYLNDPMTAPWRESAANIGWASAAAFPIQRGGQPFAVLTVCHAQPHAFDEEAIALLEEMSTDISFALDNFDRETNRKAADESLRLAASVYDTSSEGILITDADNQIVAVNPAFISITGYLAEEVVGKDPSILSSGHHDEAFYQAMWHELNTTGYWQGEIWDKRKNGEVYPKWLTINTVFNEDGTVQQRVGMFTDISQKKEAEQLIWRQANFDPLTTLPNRQMFYDRLDQDIKKAHRANRPLALMFLDLDRFKEINDTLGHDMGDVLLKEAAYRLSGCVRETDTVARLGGDEFTIILGELDDLNTVERVSYDILSKLAEPFHLGDKVVYVSVSIGITLYPEDATSIEALLKNADQAMYSAKNKGRNRYSYFTATMQLAAQIRMQITNDLREALVGNQFWIAYQPIIELESGNICKAEALIRWQHPQRGLISPAEFIPIAEDTGLIVDIGEWVFREVTQQVSIWRESYHPEFQISINKSPVQFRDENSAYASWPDQLQQLGLPGQSIVVEITEGMLMDASDAINSKLLVFRDAGIQVSLDDFGTGYSSLSYLKKFDIDYLKIDQSFTRNLTPDSEDMALCEAIIVMAHKLDMKVVAEGIETLEQRDLLIAAGCDYGQGYFFSRPIPANEFQALLQKVQT